MLLLKTIFNLNCTKEIFNILLSAEKLSIKYSHKYIEPIHIFISIFLNSNIVVYLLNINLNIINLLIKKFFLQNILLDIDIKTNKKLFSINSLIILSKHFLKKKFFNSLDLIIILLKENNYLINKFWKILSLNHYNIYNIINNYKYNIYDILNKYTLDYIPNFKYNNLIDRNFELDLCIENLSKNIKKNILLIGNSGVGRSSIIYSLINKILEKKVPDCLKNKEIKFLNLLSFIKNSQYKGDLEEQFEILFNTFKSHGNLLLICFDIHYLFNLFNIQNYSDQDYNLTTLNLFKKYFENSNIQIIGTLNYKDLLKQNKFDFKIENFFNIITIKEPEGKDLFNILINSKLKLEKFYNLKITPKIIYKTIDLSYKYLKDKQFPNKALELLDIACNKQLKVTKNNKYLTEFFLYKAISTLSNLPENILNQINNKNNNIISLENKLKKVLYGQNQAIEKITNTLKISYLGLKDKNKPLGSWILWGPSGTGKTEIAKKIAYFLFGSEKEMIRFDMSEYMEKHSLSKLIGTPPGYVGYGEGGQLTEAVNKKPYSVILFDEIEKAHEDINNIMLQILDDGRLTDSSGKYIDFSHTIIFFTSNLGCSKNTLNILSLKNFKDFYNNIKKALNKHFKPEFLNRLDDIIIFNPLNIETLIYISTKFLNQLQNQLINNKNLINLYINYNVKLFLAKIAYNPLYGARPLKRFIEVLIEKPITDLLIKFNFKKPHIISFNIDNKLNKIIYSIKKITLS
uniref:ATP-dependent Clp protease ATP-binding subunit n=1 Tax=Nephromyces sp. ex Molgula occidentalis TaxID=2544991 RepID=A0A5C1H832_9APIC|nr:ATP-dependent Clp protease ATP-binding subunit [Nephromyces sp. ex Molgula occidentalis]